VLVVNNGLSDSGPDTMVITANPVTGILSPAIIGCRIYPNPVKSHFYVQVHPDAAMPITVEIIDVTGTLRYSITAYHSGNAVAAIDIPASFRNGLYLIRLRDKDARIIYTGRFIINK